MATTMHRMDSAPRIIVKNLHFPSENNCVYPLSTTGKWGLKRGQNEFVLAPVVPRGTFAGVTGKPVAVLCSIPVGGAVLVRIGGRHIGWRSLARASNAGAARGRRVRHDLPTGFLFLFDYSCRQ